MATKASINVGQSALVKVIGDKELLREFDKLEDKFKRRLLRPAINVGLTPVVNAVKKNVPVDDGFLREEIKKHVSKRGAWGRVYVNSATYTGVDGKRKNPAKYAHLVEFGTKHKAPHSFMRAGKEESQGQALRKIQAHMRKNLKLVEKL
jgi:HK97 gp10 family phage protein